MYTRRKNEIKKILSMSKKIQKAIERQQNARKFSVDKKIFIEQDTPLTREEVREKLILLRDAVEASKGEIASPLIKEAMKKAVPTFVDPEKVNKNAEKSEEMKMTVSQQ